MRIRNCAANPRPAASRPHGHRFRTSALAPIPIVFFCPIRSRRRCCSIRPAASRRRTVSALGHAPGSASRSPGRMSVSQTSWMSWLIDYSYCFGQIAGLQEAGRSKLLPARLCSPLENGKVISQLTPLASSVSLCDACVPLLSSATR